MRINSPVESRAALILRQSPIPELRRLTVEETDDAVVLRGQVTSYYVKQLAQEAVRSHLDGRALHNRIIVVNP